jgi:hypothetical protein
MQHRLLSLIPPLVCGALGACGDNASAPSPPIAPATTPAGAAAIRGNADFVNGTLTFAPITPAAGSISAAPGVSGQIYGVQGTTVRIYNSAVTVTNPSSPGKKTFSANVGVRNLLAFKIGDEQSGTPVDTMGIFVFVNSGPTVTRTSSSCPGCTVTVKNGHGVLTFNAPLQHYWYWLDRLDAANGARDTTLTRKSWVFEADTQVTGFSFDVLVSAAWSSPNETRWKVDYQGDSLPDTQTEPRWLRAQTGAGTYNNSTTAGQLRLSPGAAPNAIDFYRRDSMATATSAYVEASVKYNGPTITLAGARLLIDNNARSVGFGIAANRVGFINTSNTFIGTPFTINTTTALHVYQLRKYAADSGVFFVDGVRRGALPYASFSTTVVAGTAPLVGFGHLGAGTATSDWDYVVYEIGAALP